MVLGMSIWEFEVDGDSTKTLFQHHVRFCGDPEDSIEIVYLAIRESECHLCLANTP